MMDCANIHHKRAADCRSSDSGKSVSISNTANPNMKQTCPWKFLHLQDSCFLQMQRFLVLTWNMKLQPINSGDRHIFEYLLIVFY